MADRTFDPAFLFHKDGRTELIDNAETYEALLKTKEWANTPAAFGVITAPNKEQQMQMILEGKAQAAAPTLAPPRVEVSDETVVRVTHLEQQLQALERVVRDVIAMEAVTKNEALPTLSHEVEERLAMCDREIENVHRLFQQLSTSVLRLETNVSKLQEEPQKPKAPADGRQGGRS